MTGKWQICAIKPKQFVKFCGFSFEGWLDNIPTVTGCIVPSFPKSYPDIDLVCKSWANDFIFLPETKNK